MKYIIQFIIWIIVATLAFIWEFKIIPFNKDFFKNIDDNSYSDDIY